MRSTKKLGKMMEKWSNRRKGHFVIYAKEGNKRFVVPLYYLNHPIFRVLLDMAEEEFGSMVHGPLQVPCEEVLMDYIICLLRKSPPVEVERALLHHILNPTFPKASYTIDINLPKPSYTILVAWSKRSLVEGYDS